MTMGVPIFGMVTGLAFSGGRTTLPAFLSTSEVELDAGPRAALWPNTPLVRKDMIAINKM